jgi:hypothetical protein
MIEQAVVFSVAVFALAQWFAFEDGPFWLFKKIRDWLWTPSAQEYDDLGRPKPLAGPPSTVRGQLGAVMRCPICSAPYWAIILLGVWAIPVVGQAIVFVLAVCGGSYIARGLSRLGHSE